MREVVLVRVDERFLHGQTLTQWVPFTQPKTILLADDELVKNQFMCTIFKGVKPSYCALEIKNVEDAVAFLKEDVEDRVMVITKVPQTIVKLLDGGIEIKKAVLGNAGGNPQRKKLHGYLSASPEEIAAMKDIVSRGVDLLYQMTPRENGVKPSVFLK